MRAYDTAFMRRPRNHLCAALTLAVALLGGCSRAPEGPPNILLVTIDTLRADHLSAWGYPRRTSPFLDQLAAGGVRFAEAQVQWPKTGPSFASIFTATYARDNGIVRRVGIPLPDSFRMLAEELGDRGYATRAVVANGALGKDFNFQQGFDEYVESWRRERAVGGDTTGARHVTELAIELARGLESERPFFLWVHYIDPHFPYQPPADHRDRFQGDAHAGAAAGFEIDVHRELERRDMLGIGFGQVLAGRSDLAFYVARYDAEIAYADAQIRRLWGRLEEHGLTENTVTAVTSDHGESLGEHRYFFDHGRFAFQTCLHVPLILHAPRRLDQQVVETPVGLIDLAPTLLEMAGAELPQGRWMQGRSLLRYVGGDERRPREPEVVYSEAGYATDDAWQKVVRWGRWKLLMAPWQHDNRWIGGRGDRFTLYDLETDPGELHDLKDEEREIGKRLHDVMKAWLEREPFNARVEAEGTAAGPATMTDETRKQLEALGYL